MAEIRIDNSGLIEKDPTEIGESAANWGKLREVKYAGSKKPEVEPRGLELTRQERKIVRFFSSGGDTNVITMDDADLSQNEAEDVLMGMQSGRIGINEDIQLLLSINDPIGHDGSDKVFERIRSNRHYSRIIADLTGKGFDYWQFVTKDEMMEFHKQYPTPFSFESERENFLELIYEKNSQSKYEEYVESMDGFCRTMFGKRQEYYDALRDLRNKASEMAEELDNKEELIYSGYEIFDNPLKVTKLVDVEQRELLKRSIIKGDIYRYRGVDYKLTAKQLEQADLKPVYRVRFDNADIALSKKFKVGSRDVVIGYVKDDDNRVHVRSYYKSNSQGVWRFLPDYVPVVDKDGNIIQINWYGKAGDEEMLTLPGEMQHAMALLDQEPPAQMRNLLKDYYFVGTAQRYLSRKDYRDFHRGYRDEDKDWELRQGVLLRNSVYNEISSSPTIEFAKGRNGYLPPDQARPDTIEHGPNLEKCLAEYTTKTSLYGEITVRCFRSKDGSLLYTFNEDEKGRVWIGNIEARGKTNSAGLRLNWIDSGDLGTPLYEYEEIDGGYGDKQDKHGRYVCMWNGYLRHVPIIKEYKQRFGSR